MKPEMFFEKFDQFADAPDAVAKMRELVLTYATTGAFKLQSGDDEPASNLFERIVTNFKTLVQEKKIRKPKKTKPVPSENQLEPLPANWIWTRLGDAVDYGSSTKIDSTEIEESDWLLDLQDIEKTTSRLIRKKRFSDNPSKSTKTCFERGDVLYGKLRPYLDKVLVADEPGYCTTEIIPIRTYGLVEPEYLRIALKRPSFIQYATQKSYGMNLPRLGTEDARNALFPLPPLAEQKRIVAKVDELMALCDRLEAQQQDRDTRHTALARASLARFADAPTPANLNFLFHKSYDITPADLRKSILTLAVQGKLVPQDPNEERAVVLVQKIAQAMRNPVDAGSVKPPKKLTAVTDKEKTFPLPAGWVWARLQEVIDVRDGTHDSPKDSTDQDAFPLVTSRNFENGDINFETARRISAKDHFEIQKRSKVEKHDILFSMIGGNIGNQVIVKTDAPFSVKNVALFKYYDRNLTYPLFIRRYMEHLAISLQQESIGGAQPFVSLGYLRKLPIALPPTTEQHRIVAKVDQLMALVDELETQLAASRDTAKNLLEALSPSSPLPAHHLQRERQPDETLAAYGLTASRIYATARSPSSSPTSSTR